MLPVASGLFMRPTVKYTLRDAEGDANSYNEVIGQLSALSMQGKHTVVATISMGKKQFDSENPVFNAKQDSTSLRFLAGVGSVSFSSQSCLVWFIAHAKHASLRKGVALRKPSKYKFKPRDEP